MSPDFFAFDCFFIFTAEGTKCLSEDLPILFVQSENNSTFPSDAGQFAEQSVKQAR